MRWIWPSTAAVAPVLLRAGVRVARCHDVALTEALLLSRDGRLGEPVSLAAAWARLRGMPVPPDRAVATGGQGALFEPGQPGVPEGPALLDALAAVHADQLRRIGADEHPARFSLLAAAESAGGLAAAEMSFDGLPWRPGVHDELLAGLLGPRPAPGRRPRRLAELADRITEAFGGRAVNPDSPAQLVKALAADGVRVASTRSSVLRATDHPAVPLLLEYKELARLHSAHGWVWLDSWVSGGRFHPEYVVGGVVSGRWATRGGGALQIPRVLRRAVVADPGWTLVAADAAQLEPRVLAALAGDGAFAAAAAEGDLYAALAGAFGGDRGKAKIALLSAMYGGAGGEAGQLLGVLRRRFPLAAGYVEQAARAGEEGRVVRSRLGRTCPPPSVSWRSLTAGFPDPESGWDPGDGAAPDSGAGRGPAPGAGRNPQAVRAARARGRFTRNFVVQASAADWALVLLAGLRRRLSTISSPNGSPAGGLGGSSLQVSAAGGLGGSSPQVSAAGGLGGSSPQASPAAVSSPGSDWSRGVAQEPHLVFFQHDEVVVHCPEHLAEAVVAAVAEAAEEAGRLVFGETPVRFPVSTAVVGCYADAK